MTTITWLEQYRRERSNKVRKDDGNETEILSCLFTWDEGIQTIEVCVRYKGEIQIIVLTPRDIQPNSDEALSWATSSFSIEQYVEHALKEGK